MITPEAISKMPKVMPLVVPDYDFKGQARSGQEEVLMAGNHTFGSIQTFDMRGNPTDSQSDKND